MFDSSWLVTAAIVGLGISFLVMIFLVVVPDKRAVPKSRRRPDSGPQHTMLTKLADQTTETVDRLLTNRRSTLADRLELAGTTMTASTFVVLTGATALAVVAVGALTTSVLIVIIGLVAVPAGAIALLRFAAERRRSAFAKQLDETAQMLAGSLRAGYSFSQALSVVGRESDEPTAAEFTRITNELMVGRPFNDAMQLVANRMRNEDFLWIARAVAINREVGGNLADVLDGVSHTIRERAQLKRQVAALSAEGKLSAYILFALPFFVGGIIALLNPGYVGQLFDNMLGWALVVAAVILMIVGGFWLKKMVEIRY